MTDAADLPDRLNMADYVIGRAARETPRATALIVADTPGTISETWTYEDLWRAVTAESQAFCGIELKAGDRVLIRLENTSLYPIAFFGAIAAGLVPIPASAQLTNRELAYLMDDSGARLAVVDDGADVSFAGCVPVLSRTDIPRAANPSSASADSAVLDTAANDAAFLIYTSGTTGSPKGVLHAHRSVLGRRPMYKGWYGLTARDRVLHAGAFNWTFTLGTGLTDPWANGATAIVFTGEKTPDVWPKLIAATGATIFAAVPGVFRQILKYAPPARSDLTTLRHGLIAGEAPPPGLFDAWHAATGTELHEALGMSEISTFISTSPTTPRKPGTVGKPQAGRCIAVLPLEGGIEPLPIGEPGLLAVHKSDPGLMLGYWNREAETGAAMRGDWFVTSDLARMDQDGYVVHLGRNDDVMNAGGYRVAPQEIEDVLASHADIAEVACAEVQVRDGVSIIAAFIVAHSGAEIDADALRQYATSQLAAYKCPRAIVVVTALPRTSNGKIMRSALKNAFVPTSCTANPSKT